MLTHDYFEINPKSIQELHFRDQSMESPAKYMINPRTEQTDSFAVLLHTSMKGLIRQDAYARMILEFNIRRPPLSCSISKMLTHLIPDPISDSKTGTPV